MSRRLIARLLVLCSVVAVLMAAGQVAAGDPRAATDAETRARLGLRYDGLEATPAGGACAGFPFQMRLRTGAVACTHGPDPAPDGIDVRVAPSLADLRARAFASQPAGSGAAAEVAQESTAAGSSPCVGNGTAGKRLEAIYAHWAGDASRYDDIAPLIRSWAGAADTVFDDSAAKTGGSRHLRWRHDAACQPVVHEIALSDLAATTFDDMIEELFFAGFDRTDRRYVVWVDISGYYCGVGMNTFDDSPGQDNVLNGVPEAGLGLFARIDLPCWGVAAPQSSVEAHEISHTLGSVQPTSPNTSSTSTVFYGHCIDEYDTMCYADGTPKPLVFRCSSVHERLFDCQNNDYFSTSPPDGSYLATHWNTANSSFLVTVDPVAGFLDVSTSPFKNDIAWLAASGITKGCSADQESFCPKASVTRGQMAAFLVRGLGLPGTTTDFFTDDDGHPFEKDINRLAAAGITSGCSATTFCPDATITREQMAAFLDRALHLASTATDFFTDDETSIFENSINRAAAAGITTGCGGGKYCPLALVTREQMAAFLRRALS